MPVLTEFVAFVCEVKFAIPVNKNVSGNDSLLQAKVLDFTCHA
jgi:hypothetical protein